MVMFLPSHTTPAYGNASLVAEIEANGGRNNVVVISMWAMFGSPDYGAGTWGFFSFCLTATGAPTTSMVGSGPCNQSISSPPAGSAFVGRSITASGGYMMAQSALPFANPGHLRGLTMQRLFEKVLVANVPHLFMSSFNEHIGGRQASAYVANTAINMGLPYDPQNRTVWVDTYASEFSRDMEPTVEAGDRIWNMAKSCVQMYKAGQTCADLPAEACCTRADTEVFANIWSLSKPNESLLTNSAAEVAVLTSEGWIQRCNPIPGPSVFCVNTSLEDGRQGPFMLYNTTLKDTMTRPLFRCISQAG